MAKFDAQKFLLDNFGYKVVSRDPENPDIVEVEDLNEQQSTGEFIKDVITFGDNNEKKFKKFNVASLMQDVAKEGGIDPAQMEIKLSDVENPMADNPLNFVDRVKFTMARTEGDKQKFLSERYGKENVMKNAQGQYVVRDGTDWKAPEAGLAAELTADAPVIAGGIAGGKAGAAIGSGIAPGIGTLVGGAIGAGIGAAVGKLGNIQSAQKAGIRTEDDAAQVASEMGKEFLFGMAGEAAVPVAKLTGRALINASKRAVGKVASKATSDSARLAIAETISTLNGTDVLDNITYMRAPDQVAKYQDEMLSWMEKGQQDVNPLQKDMGDMVQNVVRKAKDTMNSQFQAALDNFSGATKSVKIKIDPILQSTKQQFQALGLVDEAGNWLKNNEQTLAQIADPSSRNKIKQAWGLIDRATKEGATLPVKDVQTLIGNMDDVLELAGAYSARPGEVAMSSRATKELMQIRTALKNQLIEGVKTIDSKAADQYIQMNAKYTDMRGWLDELVGGTADDKVQTTINKIIENDPIKRESFVNILKNTGVNDRLFIDGLLQRRAAIGTSPMWSPRSVYATGGALRGNSAKDVAVGVVTGGLTTPRKGSNITARTFDKLKSVAKANEFVRGLSKDQLEQLVSQPQYMKAIQQTLIQAADTRDQVEAQLMSGIGGGQQGQQ